MAAFWDYFQWRAADKPVEVACYGHWSESILFAPEKQS